MTARQFAAWREWLAAEWDEPGRTDWYLMQLAAETVNGRLKTPKAKAADFKLRFKAAGPPPSPEALAKLARSRAMATLRGRKVTVVDHRKGKPPASPPSSPQE
jgi:hypothetical protein